MASIIEGPKLAALSCGKPVYLVLLLHGAGGRGQDMLDLALGWAPEMIKADFLSLEAPFRDADGRATWRDPARPDDPFAAMALALGAALALTVGLRRPQKLAALVGFSGAYDAAALARTLENPPPTLLVHGEDDAQAPFAGMVALKEALKAQNAPVWSFKRPGLGHAIDGDGADAAGAFLARHVKHAKDDHD